MCVCGVYVGGGGGRGEDYLQVQANRHLLVYQECIRTGS